jgi:NAD-dependent SIR2 family protein deacetylase
MVINIFQAHMILITYLDEFTKAIEESEKADLCLAMGSSLTVTPAADLPEVR